MEMGKPPLGVWGNVFFFFFFFFFILYVYRFSYRMRCVFAIVFPLVFTIAFTIVFTAHRLFRGWYFLAAGAGEKIIFFYFLFCSVFV
jgi:hypothetical protein